MPKYKVIVRFEGFGEYEINAKNESEARQKYYDGEYKSYKDLPEQYCNEEIEQVKK